MSARLPLVFKAARQLSLPELVSYIRYRIGLRSGFYQRVTTHPPQIHPGHFHPVLNLPSREELLSVAGKHTSELLEQAAEIVDGKVRLFGTQPVPLQLTPPGKLEHWTVYERGHIFEEVRDIKFLWEPARFGWTFTLGRAYLITGDDIYPQAFWKHVENFLSANPPYLGPNWCSAQEVALRITAFVFALQVFSPSSQTTPERSTRLIEAVAKHASRIPPTLVYARAQNNNHLLTEAAGLYTAGLALAEHPSAHSWKETGWNVFNQALQKQIASDGSYIQHSTNYQRLMLQIALWVSSLSTMDQPRRAYIPESRHLLSGATRWLLALTEPSNGSVPNLGPNDGAYILPLSACPFADYRPVLQASAAAFLGERPFPGGPWDEMNLWFKASTTGTDHITTIEKYTLDSVTRIQPPVLRNHARNSWAYLRAARFKSRPGHADQLHLDLWWHGLNIALDPGTYLYNSPPPWDNSLTCTAVHNTVQLGELDQMTHAGRFLWLDWAQAEIVSSQFAEDRSLVSLTAQHDGFLRAGVLHRRMVQSRQDGWWVKDDLLPCGIRHKENSPVQARLHWLLPDWPWEVDDSGNQPGNPYRYAVRVKSPHGWVNLLINTTAVYQNSNHEYRYQFQLIRAGELVHGDGQARPTWGWISPTYNQKQPALSVAVYQTGSLPLSFTSRWILP